MDKADFIVWVNKLQADYRPSRETLGKIAQVELVAIVGPTGVGKTTLIDELNIPGVLSDVTRDIRPGEKNSRSYHFRDDYLGIIEDIKQGNYVQFLISSGGEFYGTRADSYPSAGKCTMAIVAAAIPLFSSIGFKAVKKIYIMPPSYVEWMRRIGGVRTKDLLSRISEARSSILMALEDDSYSFVLNDSVDSALNDIHNILQGNDPDTHRAELAIGTADLLLERIGSEEDN